MFKALEDGSAIVYHIPVSPFVPLQHNRIDVSTVNRLANFALRFAMEHGWCFCPHPRSSACEGSEAVDEGYVNLGGDTTLFYAGVDAELDGEVSKFDGKIIPASMFFWSQFWVSHVGNSSFGIYGRLWHYETPNEELKVPFGVFTLTGVAVSKKARKPVPILGEWAALLRDALQKHGKGNSLPKVARIDFWDSMMQSGLFLGDKCCQVSSTLPTHASVTPLTVAYRQEFALRQTDIDFNRHVNQMALIQLVINTFRSALGDKNTIFSRLLYDGMSAIWGDLLLRRLRIDYTREIPMDHSGVCVTLFFLDDFSRDAVIASSRSNRQGTTVELCFVAHGIQGNWETSFVAAVGKLFLLA